MYYATTSALWVQFRKKVGFEATLAWGSDVRTWQDAHDRFWVWGLGA